MKILREDPATAHIPIVGDTTNWNFGFVQIAKLSSGRAWYAGRKKSEGGIGVYFDNAMSSSVLTCFLLVTRKLGDVV